MTSNQSDTEKKKGHSNEATEAQQNKTEPADVSEPKHELKAKVSNWWQQEKDKIAHGGMLKFLQDNKGRLDKTLSSIHQNNFFYRFTNRIFALVSVIAGWVDKVKDFLLNMFLN